MRQNAAAASFDFRQLWHHNDPFSRDHLSSKVWITQVQTTCALS
jgi:hypothetical protein